MVSWRSICTRVAAVAMLLSFVIPVAAQSTADSQKKDQPAASDQRLGFPDTPEGRIKHFGLSEDPGVDPDPNKVWMRQGTAMIISKFERKWAKYDDPRPGYVRPFGFANFAYEIYRQDEDSVWVWTNAPQTMLPPTSAAEPEEVPLTSEGPDELKAKAEAFVRGIRPEFETLEPGKSAVTLAFKESSEGLPQLGSWRNSLDLADMNGDGNLDIVAPPQRGIGGPPSIYLGDGKGHWTLWKDAKFGIGFNYGSVSAADLNKDGKMDLVFGVHLTGVRAFLGDGKGNFKESSEGLPARYFPTRRAIVSDVNADGYPDIVALNEGPTLSQNPEERATGRLKAFINNGKATHWKEINIAGNDKYPGGDWLSAGNFNGDRYPDFVTSTIYFNGTDIVFLSDKTGSSWEAAGKGNTIPYLTYYWASTTGKFTSSKKDDAVIGYMRFWPETVESAGVTAPEERSFSGLDLLRFDGKAMKRVPIARWPSSSPIWGMASGDFDRDGNLDVVYSELKPERRLVILLGDGKGGFRRSEVRGLEIKPNTSYDLNVADVNKDGRPDIIINYEASSGLATGQKDGAIQVFLNEGGERAAVK